MNINTQNNEDQEIDLSVLTNKISEFYKSILSWIFGCVLFAKRNLFLLIGLFIIGYGLGFYLDLTNKSYKSEIIVSPGFNSVNYMYSKIDLLSSKLIENDTVFFKNIGIKNPKKISLFKVEPVIDLYALVNKSAEITGNGESTQNFELLKLLAEDGDLKKVITEDLTNKQYSRHLITINTIGKISDEEVINPILNFLNDNNYFEKIRKMEVDNINEKISKNEKLTLELDDLISKISASLNNNTKSNNLVYYNENTPITGLIERKVTIVNELAQQKMYLIDIDTFIKKSSNVNNIKNTKDLNGKRKLVLPFLLIFSYIFFTIFMSFYKKQKAKI